MRNSVICAALLIAALVNGCVSKSEAQRQAQQAFMAGQQQASAAASAATASKNQAPTVTVHGDVKFEVVPWTEDLTLAKAIYIAEYQGMNGPSRIDVTRNGETVQINPRDLLQGKDIPLQAGDVIDLRR